MSVDWSQFTPVQSDSAGGATAPVLTRPTPAVDWSQFSPAPPDARASHSTIGDIGRSALGALEAGAGEGVQGIGDVTGWQGASNLGKSIQAAGARESANVSPQFAEKTSHPILSREGFNLTNIASKAINSVAGMAPQLAGTALASLAGPEVGIPVGAALFGTQGEAGGRNAGEEQVAALTPEQIAKVPAYQQYLQQGMTPDQARAKLSESAATRGAVTSGLFGAGLGLVGEIPGVNAVGKFAANKLVRGVGRVAGADTALASRGAARVIGKGIGEGVGFGGINAAGQVASNVTNPVPTPALENVGEAAAGGLLPGFALGAGRAGIARLTRPSGPLGRAAQTAQETGATEPYPGAAPGSLADAANTLQRAAPATATETPTSSAEAQSTITRKVPPPAVPWVNAETGERRTPAASEIVAAFHRMADDQAQASVNNVKLTVGLSQLSDAWGVPLERLKSMRKVAQNERAKGITTNEAEQRAAEDFAQQGTTDAFQQADRGLNDLKDQANAVQASLADARARLDQQQARGSVNAASSDVAKPEPPAATSGEPDAEAPALPSEATGKQPDADRQATPPAPAANAETAPVEPAAREPNAVPSEPVNPPALAARGADREAPALSGEASAPAAREEAAIPGSSSNPPEGGIAAKTTPDNAETQTSSPNIGEKPDNVSASPATGDEATAGVAAPAQETGGSVETAAKESAAHPENERPEPTPAQQEAGNFKMGHVNLHGLDVSIEMPKGGTRRGTDSAGKPWERATSDHYGYVRRTEGADGEQVDVYLGPHAEDPKSSVFVIDQVKPGTKTFDEHKAMVGYARGSDARASYDANFPKGLKTFGGIRKMSMDEFKDWVKHGDTTKPVSESMRTAGTVSKVRERAVEAVVAPGDRVTVTQGMHAGKAATVVGRTRSGVRLKLEDGTQTTLSAKVMKLAEKPAEASAQKSTEGPSSTAPLDIAHTVGKTSPFENTTALVHNARDEITRRLGANALKDVNQGNMFRSDDVTRAVHDGQYESVRDYAKTLPTPVTEDQIGHQLATRAFEGVSHRADERGKSMVRGYVRDMVNAWREAEAKAKGDPEALSRAKEVFANLQRGYADRLKTYLNSHSRVFSTMITGAAKFPVARMEKLNRVADKRSAEASEFYSRMKTRMLKATEAPVDHSPAGELAAVRANLQARETQQERMKAANAAIRRNDDAKLRTLGFDDASIAKLKKPDDLGRVGYPAFSLRNNNAEIRRLQTRVKHLERRVTFAAAGPRREEINGVRVEQDAQDNRIRLRFNGKPPAEVLTALRGAGWKWSPKNEAWQRQLSGNAQASAKRILALLSNHREESKGSFSKPNNAPARREYGLPRDVREPVTRFRNDQPLKRDPDYKAAKGGDSAAAVRLVKRLAGPVVMQARERFGKDAIFVAPHAEEAGGKNAIPHQLAEALAIGTGGRADDEILQTNRTFHTGGDMMQRLIARPVFEGDVVKGGKYVLVDDVSTSGGTFADLADYIQRNGGEVVGAVSLTNAARGGKLAAEPRVQRRLEERHGDVIREQLGIEPSALTAEEAGYLTGFRSADEIRNRIASARQERSRRLRTKGIQGLASRPPSAVIDNAPLNAGRFASKGVARDHVQKLVDRATATWGENQPRVRVVAEAEDLPASAKVDAEGRPDSSYQTAEGYYDPKTGTAYLVAANLDSPRRALEVLAHEAIGHHGVESVVDDAFGKGAWQKIVDGITHLDTQGKPSDAMRKLLQETHRRYPGADPLTFAKEFLAVSAEKGIGNVFLDRVMTAIRKFLRQIMPHLQLNERELRQVLVRAERYVRETMPYRDRVKMVQAHAFSEKPDTFYSALVEAMAAGKGAPKKADAAVWKQWLDGAQRRGEFKGAEREWVGLDQWLDEHKVPVTRAELNDFVRQNQVRVQEVLHADDVSPDRARDIVEDEDGNFVLQGDEGEKAGSTKFGEYTLPGGRNYRELLLTLPRKPTANDPYDQYNTFLHAMYRKYGDGWRNKASVEDLAEDRRLSRAADTADGVKQNYQSNHFEEPNILAHVRMNDRTGPDGEKILHVEEVQSDWHQAGRKKGYALTAAEKAEHAELAKLPSDKATTEQKARFDELSARQEGDVDYVPDAPLKKEWPMLAMKRVLRYAADHGYDKVTWTTGEQQAERYDLSKSIDRLIYLPKNDGGLLFAYNKDGRQVLRQPNVKPDTLPDYVGKEAAQRLMDQPTTVGDSGQNVKQLKRADLKLGGEGMKTFYDKMLPNELNKYAKQWGTKVGESAIDTQDANRIDAARKYEGPERSVDDVLKAAGNVDSVEIERQLRAVARAMKRGEFFADAMQREGSISAAKALGGNMVIAPHRLTNVHSIDITPAMRESVMQGQPLFARRQATTEAYDRRIDELYRGAAPTRDGATVLDRSDMLDMLGYGDKPLRLAESKVGSDKHNLTAADWKKVPEWIDNPVAVFKSSTVDGRLVLFAPDLVNGRPLRIILEPNVRHGSLDMHLVVNAYDESGTRPTSVDGWLKDKKLLYLDPKQSPALVERSGLRLPRDVRQLRGYKQRVLTEQDLVKYRADHPFDETPANPPQQPGGSFSQPEPVDPSQEPARGMADLDNALKDADPGGILTKAKAWVRGKAEDLRPAALGAIQTSHLLELMDHSVPLKAGAGQYDRAMHQLDADRQQLMTGAADAKDHPKDMLRKGAVNIAEELRRLAYGKGLRSLRGKVRPEAQKLFDVMHQSTLQRMDPSKAYERLTIENAHGDAVPWTHAEVKARLKLLRELMLQRGGDAWADREKLQDEVKYLRNIAKMEAQRERDWPKLQADYEALTPEAKRLYGEVRDWYSQYRDATEEALIHNIEAMDVPETYRRSLVDRMRLRFEEQRREGVYFPLNRDGDYWVSFQDKDGNEGFKMFEQYKDFKSGVQRLRNTGFQIDATGRRSPDAKAKDAPSGTFVREVIDTLQKAKVSEKVQDEVYQTFLRAMPELSMRKHSIHRRNIAGFSEDALRAFAKNSYHGAHQLARLRHAQDMQMTLEAMKAGLDNWRRGENATDERKEPDPADIVKADALYAELQKRHEWIMSPNDQRLANMANSIGFVWYLGASPASAMTNLTQIAQTVAPVLGARHGWGKASRMLAAAWRDAARTGGHMDKLLKNDDERRAFLQMQQRGDFSKTQSHTLAGLAEGNVLQTSPAWSKTMNAVSWMFHTAELVNREATGMAAYRLARSEGKSFDEAVAYAGKVNAETNFDYSAANRPRYMQGNVQRIALQFKNYSVSMSWLFFRNLHQAFKGATPEERRIAKRTVAGIMGMTALLAGATGLPLYNTVRMAANAANALFGDDDEPWNFDDAFHRWLADNLGQDAARLIAEGPTNYLTGANLASRTSMANLWIHDDDQRLEGADAYHALLENLAGPMGGITQNFYVAAEDVRRGHLERGIERILPTAVKNTIKSLRYAHEGVNSLRGDPIVPDVSGYEDFLQAIGFQPARVADQYRINTALKNFTGEVKDRRGNLMNAYAMAVKAGDGDDQQNAMRKIADFNRTHPEVAITRPVLQSSLRQRAYLSSQAKHGVVLNRRLAAPAQAYAGAEQ